VPFLVLFSLYWPWLWLPLHSSTDGNFHILNITIYLKKFTNLQKNYYTLYTFIFLNKKSLKYKCPFSSILSYSQSKFLVLVLFKKRWLRCTTFDVFCLINFVICKNKA
jgi:hypothetical protein